MQDILQILSKLDWSPLYISIKTGIVATFISFFLGIFAARKVLKASGRVRAVIDGILTLPMVLPPTVAGFFLGIRTSMRLRLKEGSEVFFPLQPNQASGTHQELQVRPGC